MQLAFVAILAFAAPLKSIHFEGDAAMREALARELGAVALVEKPDEASLWVRARVEERLIVEVIVPPATVLVTRAFALDAGPVPAIRAAVLLIADAAHGEHDAPVVAEPAPLPSPTATISPAILVVPPPALAPSTPEPRRFGVALGGLYGRWRRPSTTELGGSLSALYFLDDWTFALRFATSGLGCCELSSANARGRTLELALFAEASTTFAELGPLSFGALARAGSGYVRFTGRALFQSAGGGVIESSEQSSSTFDARAELGGAIALDLLPDRLDLVLSAGATIRMIRFKVLAPTIISDDQPLDPGAVMPWAELAVRAQIF